MKKVLLFFSGLVFLAFAVALGWYVSGNVPRSIIYLGDPDAFGIVAAIICIGFSVAYGISNLVACFTRSSTIKKGAISCK
jgi:hypothetical protein